MTRTRDFDVSKYPEMDIKGFTLQIMTGNDSLDATARAVGKGDKPNPMLTFSARSNLIADAIVRIDGQDVIRPYVQWEDLSLRTQTFIEKAFDCINGVTNGEMEDFLVSHGLKPSKTQDPTAPPA